MSVANDTRVTPSLDESHDAAGIVQGHQPVSPAGDVRALAGAGVFSPRAATLATFYGMLFGVRFEHRVHADGRDHRIARVAGVHFEIKETHAVDGARTPDAPAEVATSMGVSSSIELSFTVPDAAASYDYALKLGATPFIPVKSHVWGSFGTVLDPDGNRVGLFSTSDSDTTHDTVTSSEGDR